MNQAESINNLRSRVKGRTIRLETDSERGQVKVIIRNSDDEVFLYFSQDTVQQLPKLVCSALDRKMDLQLAGTDSHVKGG